VNLKLYTNNGKYEERKRDKINFFPRLERDKKLPTNKDI
jgi:hypothetical protein